MADEQAFREPDDKIHDYELDEAFEIALDIDAVLREYSVEYRRNFPDEQKQREEIADSMLSAKTYFVKHLISSLLGNEGDALMKRLNEYETEFRKNQYSVYRLKPDCEKDCKYKLQAMRSSKNYINKDMYELIFALPIKEKMKPMGVELDLIMSRSAGIDVPQPDLRDIITVKKKRISVKCKIMLKRRSLQAHIFGLPH